MKGLKNGIQSLIFILVIIVLGGFLLPSTQKIEKTIIIKSSPEKVMIVLIKSIDSIAFNKIESAGKVSFMSKTSGFSLQHEVAVKAAKEGCELTWVAQLDAGGSILNRYRLLVNRSLEEGYLKEKMILIKLASEEK